MQIGDLVRDIDFGDYGIITAIDRLGLFRGCFVSGVRDWLSDTYLEVINESR